MTDTAEIQGLIDQGPGVVTLDHGRIYTLKQAGTVTARITGSKDVEQPYALMLRHGVTLDLNGARLRLADEQNCALVVNESLHYQDTPDEAVGLVNGTIDANGAHQSAPAAGVGSSVVFVNVNGLTLDRLVFEDAYDAALRVQAAVNMDVGFLLCTGSQGDAFKLGIYSSAFAYDARVQGTFRRLEAHHCENTTAVGNPLTMACRDSWVGRLVATSCAGGFKVQDGTERLVVVSAAFDGGDNGTTNSGLKLQGTADAPVQGVFVGQVLSSGCAGPGLYLENAHRCAVFTYVGVGNASLGTHPDVWLGTGRRNWIGTATSIDAGGVGIATRAGSWCARVERASITGQAGQATSLQGVAPSIGSSS